MADTIKKYVSLENLGLYDDKIKALIDSKDADILASANAYADGLKDNYDPAGSAATAEANAKSYTDDEVAKANSAASAAQEDVDNLATYVGTIPATSEADNVIAYIQERTHNVASSDMLEGLMGRVSSVEGDLDTIKNDYLKDSDKTELQGAIDVIDNAVSTISADYLKSSDRTELEGDIDAVDAKVDTLIGEDANKSVRTIANEELAKQLIPETAQESLDTLQEIAQWIQNHPSDASAMNAAITALQNKVDTGDKTVSAYVTDAINALSIGDYAKAADLTALAGRVEALESKFGEGEGSVSDLISNAIDAEEVRVDAELAKKVDKVEGKGLSTNDLTDELKGQYDAAYAHSQVAHAPSNAQENLIESVKVNGVALTITGKAVDISVPVDNAELTNGAGYLVANDIANKADKGTTLADYGIADAYTSAQTDEAIANAMEQLKECTTDEINALFA